MFCTAMPGFFVESPIPLEDLSARSEIVPLSSLSVHVAGIADLISMKRRAGRPHDPLDVEELERIDRERS